MNRTFADPSSAGMAVSTGLGVAGTPMQNHTPYHTSMSHITTKDGTSIFYKDWGPKTGRPITFSHGWPLT
ncbi:MAG TPA: hypothetical protein VGE39_24140, partial [Prosthecobacter sp.]